MKPRVLPLLLVLSASVACRTAPPQSAPSSSRDPCYFPESSGALADKGQFHAAMKALPEALRQSEACDASTGSSREGATSYLRASVLDRVAHKGDAEWGAILDDASIPHAYKTDMLFEIIELRLGKGSVYLANDATMIVPRNHPIDLDHDMIRLPEKRP